MSNVKSQVVSGVKWSLLAKSASQIFSWVATFFVIRILSPSDFGIIELATAIISLAMALGISGFSDVIVQKKQHDEKLCNQVFTISVGLNLFLFVTIFLSAGFVANWFNAPELKLVVQLLSINMLTVAFTIIPSGILKREMNFKLLALIQMVTAIANASIALIFALAGFEYWSIPLGAFFSMIIFATLINYKVRTKVSLTKDFSDFRTFFNFGMFTIINRTLNFVFLKADTFIIGKILGVVSLGTYSVGSQLANLPLEKTAETINQVSYSGYAKIKDEPKTVAYYYLQSSRIIALLVFPVFWGMAVTAELIVGILLGEKWLESTIVFQVLAIVMPFRIFQLSTHSSIAGLGFPKFNTKNLFVLCLIIPLSVYFGVEWGLLGAAIGWSTGYFIFFIWMMWRSLAFLKVGFFQFTGAIGKPMLASLLMMLVTNQVIHTVGGLTVFNLFVSIISGAITYLGVVLLVEKQAIELIKKLRA